MPHEIALPYEDAAHRVTTTGWACKTCGRFYGGDGHSEHAARYCCCKDRPCGRDGCGNRADRAYTACEPCREKARRERIESRRVEWDGEFPVCTEGDRYLFDGCDLDCYLDGLDEPTEAHELDLEICEPAAPPRFDISDFLCDHLPEDYDLGGKECGEIEDVVAAWIKEHVGQIWVGTGRYATPESIRRHIAPRPPAEWRDG